MGACAAEDVVVGVCAGVLLLLFRGHDGDVLDVAFLSARAGVVHDGRADVYHSVGDVVWEVTGSPALAAEEESLGCVVFVDHSSDCKWDSTYAVVFLDFPPLIPTPQACFIWIGISYAKLGAGPTGLDFILQPARWAEAYIPFLILFTTGYWTQLSLYWILGTFTEHNIKSTARTSGLFRAFTTCGMAVSYGINSNAGMDPTIPFYVNCALLVVVVPCMVALIRLIPEWPHVEDHGESSGFEQTKVC